MTTQSRHATLFPDNKTTVLSSPLTTESKLSANQYANQVLTARGTKQAIQLTSINKQLNIWRHNISEKAYETWAEQHYSLTNSKHTDKPNTEISVLF
jgi:hypothetical protein